jgi:Tol biopolymer transport system component
VKYRCWACVLLAAGCGRWGFSGRISDDAAIDATSGDAASDASICHSGTWGTPQPIASTITGSQESDPSITTDELTLYFLSNRSGGDLKAIWQATRASRSDEFGAPTLVSELDALQDDGDPEISPDGRTMYFHSNRAGTDLIYTATRPTLTDKFVVDGQLAIMNQGSTAFGPSISADELTLYFTHNQLDVGYATRMDRSSPFSFVRDLTEVNAPPTDGNASISADGLELFFDSYRNGPAAIFVATRASTADVFSAPTELASLAVGSTAAGTPEISADGRTLYFFINDGTQIDLAVATRDCP